MYMLKQDDWHELKGIPWTVSLRQQTMGGVLGKRNLRVMVQGSRANHSTAT